VCKGFLVGLAQENKAGVRGQVKRLLPEAMEVKVHQKILLNAFTSLLLFNQAYREDRSLYPQVITFIK
jgi:hypothetical protein